MSIKSRIKRLRDEMSKREYNAWIIPSSDPHQSEYVADRWKSRAWISGFTGSAGTVVVTENSAGLWTDGRYFIQAEKELSGSGIILFKMGLPDTPSVESWLKKELSEGETVGVDADVFSVKQAEKLSSELSSDNIKVDYGEDIIDVIWEDRPPIPREKVFDQPVELAGKSRGEKLSELREKMKEKSLDYHVFSSLDDIAWLFNIRGKDVKCNPVVVSFALVSADKAFLCIDEHKLSSDIKQELDNDNITIRPYGSIKSVLSVISAGETVMIDPKRVSIAIKNAVDSDAVIESGTNITTHMKAQKNSAEITGMKNAHVRDGIAMVKFLKWLEDTVGKEKVTEISAAEKLESFRKENELFMGPSFDTISGYGANGAIIHYCATPESDTEIRSEGIYLVDSGGQYRDGTTDITRTVAMGTPDEKMKKHFTLVLMGHIDLARVIFHANMATGTHIEALARIPLWKNGLNFNHGTGHGVGAYLNVHEGPQTISPRWNDVKLKPGMIMSNEPGYYLEDAYGIRIENLILTIEHEETDCGKFLAFETITLCPIDLHLVDRSLMREEHVEWLNLYHENVRKKLTPFLDEEHADWLRRKTEKLG